MLIPVDQAIHTPGALLFHFASEPQPGTGEPDIAHVAISLGNGKTIEAADPQDGVVEWNSGGGRFNYAAVIPGIGDVPSTGAASTLAADATVGDAHDPLAGNDPLEGPVWQEFDRRLGEFHGHGLHPGHEHVGHGDHGVDVDHHGGLDLGH